MSRSKNRRNHKQKIIARYLNKVNERGKLFNQFKKEQQVLADKRKKELEDVKLKTNNTEEE